jgi:hypothetical protein
MAQEAETLEDRSLARPLEEFRGNAAIQNLASGHRARTSAPGSIGQSKVAAGVPLARERIKLLCSRVRGCENHIAHAGLPW